MRAAEPVEAGSLVLHEFGAGYEVFGEPDAPAVLLLPTWQIVHSRIWKMQVPFLARAFRVITFDMPGNGNGERTTDPAAFEYVRVSRQALGVLDHLDIERASLVGYSRSCAYCIWLAATEPERVERVVASGDDADRAAESRERFLQFGTPLLRSRKGELLGHPFGAASLEVTDAGLESSRGRLCAGQLA